MILAIDTTHAFGSIALLDGEDVLEEVCLHSEDGFGHVVFGDIERLLQRHHRIIGDIECFAAASGPGAFTGVRVGLTCAKGLAEATGKRVAPVSNLQALAAFGSGPLRAPVLDARRGQVYGGLYDGDLRAIVPEVVTGLPDWLQSLPSGPIEFICSGVPLNDSLAGTRFSKSPVVDAPALAGAIGRIAFSMMRDGTTLDPAQADANYVRRPDAELLWKDPLSRGPSV